MKVQSRTLFRHVGPLSLFALLTTHCGAEPGNPQSNDELSRNEPGPSDQADGESVSEAQSALISTTCASSFTISPSSSQTITVVPLGCFRTAPGFHRGIPIASQTGQLSNCFVQTDTNHQPVFLTQNPRDARVQTLVGAAPFAGGTCTVTVVENSDCAHAPCTTGVALDPTCSPNVAVICAGNHDPFCCSSQWDSMCVSEVATIAEESCK